MESLKIYRVDDKYVRFLYSRDRRVQFNKDARRPYVGVVLYVGGFKYFVPMESPKPNHVTMKSGTHLMKLDGGRLGMLGFNNMLPIPDAAIIELDIGAEPDACYAELLEKQAYEINRDKADILSRANRTYFARVNGNNKFLEKICCDFKKLERACNSYNPNYIPRRR